MRRIAQLDRLGAEGLAVASGDTLRVLRAVGSILPYQHSMRVAVEGAVLRPGKYLLAACSHVGDAIRACRRPRAPAFVHGAGSDRENVCAWPQDNHDRRLRDLETDALHAASNRRISRAEEASTSQATLSAHGRSLGRGRALRPTGSLALQMTPDVAGMLGLALEDEDLTHDDD